MAPHVKPDETVSVRPTVPVNPFRNVTVKVVVGAVLMFPVTKDGAVIEKSVKPKVTVVEWLTLPLVPVIVRT